MNEQTNTNRSIDRIIYLASLVSDPRSIDVTLNKLRAVTATGAQQTLQGRETLEAIQSELEDYLVHRERLRSFTEKLLQTNLERHFSSEDPLRKIRAGALGRIIATIIAAGLVTAVPAIFKIIQGQVVLAFFVCTLFVGLALVFQSFKKDLVTQLRGSLNYLMAATVGTGLFALNFPIVAASSYLERLPLMQHGGFLIGAVPVYGFYYVAFYLYAKQLGVKIPRALRPWGTVITAIVVAIIATIIPHPVAVPDEAFFDLAVVGFAVSVYLSAAAAILGFMTVPRTTKVYSQSTFFLAISMVLQTIGNGNFLLFVTFPSGDFSVNDQKGQILTAIFIVIALIFQYIAAYKSKTSLR